MCKSKYLGEACSNHENDPCKLWNTIDEVCCRKPKSSFVKKLEIDDKQLTDSADSAKAFNEHFSTIGGKPS